MSNEVSINSVANYICFRASEAGENISVLKLHKLLYYVQAWHLALYSRPLFEEEFEAWVHGPVSKAIFIKYRDTKNMYSPIFEGEWKKDFLGLSEKDKAHIDSVLDAYMHLSGIQLEHLTHNETPWIEARGGIDPYARCSKVIRNDTMQSFYSSKISQ